MHDNLHLKILGDRLQKFGPDGCFMCGVDIPPGSKLRTEEHVFPKWLLRDLDLWNRSVTQLNGRLIRYRRLVVPCCQPCNGVDLSGVEARVKAAYFEGFDAFKQLDRRDLFIWLGKIYYGLVYRESLEPRFVEEQKGERLVPNEHLESIAFHHFLLQTVADRVAWAPPSPGPASFHFFECLDSEIPEWRFDYMDDLYVPMLGLRLGRIGIICVLQDWGRSEGAQEGHLVAAREVMLHATQFREVYSRLSYMTKAFWRNNGHLVVGGPERATVTYDPQPPFEGVTETRHLAEVLASAWQVPLEAIFDGDRLCSTIFDQSGEIASMPDNSSLFPAPFSPIGLWPWNVDLTEEGFLP
ncbi:hypothetical protein LTI14_10625 [Nesterenkonia sp. YGD6]|uniref:hypothetical protein n=1 Tax=Nesterenkonia sp. YGD6 TaxID=2901231 RepID=UPI001F4D11AC|nr:hypothetical protein [Nesterenkonia sp. YGD6]MCH8563664.1 hypothetical protein [Nesterenkonia sp. YGD6]